MTEVRYSINAKNARRKADRESIIAELVKVAETYDAEFKRTDSGHNPYAESWRTPEQKHADDVREFAECVFNETLTRLCDRAFELGHDDLFDTFADVVAEHSGADLERRYVELREKRREHR